MKSKFAAFILLFAAVFVLASCLNNDDDYTYYDDSAITSFSVTAGNQTLHVKTASGKDSLVTNKLTLSSYKFYIDQQKCEIYNPDSLPCGVNASKLLCSVSSLNGGTVLIQSRTSDSLSYVSTSDSLDFSADRVLCVYSNSGSGVRKYTVKVNVHKELPDTFVWNAMPDCEALKSLKAVKAVALGETMLLLGTDGTRTTAFAGGSNGWTALATDIDLSADAYQGVVVKGGQAYLSNSGDILSTADGSHWTTVATTSGITRLVAASSLRLYGYATDGRLMASDDSGLTWTAATIDDDQTLLPAKSTAYATLPVKTNSETERVLLIGTRDAALYPSDTTMTVWGKIDEAAGNSENMPWAYYDVDPVNTHCAPLLANFCALAYDGNVLLFGTKDGETVPSILQSRDNGITWNTYSKLDVPYAYSLGMTKESAATYALAANSKNVLWLVNAASGKTWCGRICRLGWQDEQTDFKK